MKIHTGNNLESLKSYPDNYFDAIVTDPPYGLGKEPDAPEMLKAWVETGYLEVKGSGFMGKEWDAFVPQPIFWKEVFRVLKHGGHVVSFFGTRTYDWGVMAMRLAGFEVRDCIQWVYGSGFPKSHNISKAIDKMYGEVIENKSEFTDFSKTTDTTKHIQRFKKCTECNKLLFGQDPCDCEWRKHKGITKEAKQWNGWGSALKPANEPIVLARKPLEKGLSIAENVLKWGTGGINIDATRVEGAKPDCKNIPRASWRIMEGRTDIPETTPQVYDSSQGRFPANVILTHHPECTCNGTKKIKGSNSKPQDIGKGREGDFTNGIYGAKQSKVTTSHTDNEGNEEIEDWTCHEDCPIRIMDEQSGNRLGFSGGGGAIRFANAKGGKKLDTYNYYSDSGGASRFFYCAKASKSERNKGLDGFEAKAVAAGNQAKAELKRGNLEFNLSNKHNKVEFLKNHHPTVKPIKLMQYLVRLITPPNGIVLDPFMGSGTTGIACKLEGFEFVGMELDPEYAKIAEARITNYTEEKEVTKKVEKNNDNQQLDFNYE